MQMLTLIVVLFLKSRGQGVEQATSGGLREIVEIVYTAPALLQG